jgi:hypothetical protein
MRVRSARTHAVVVPVRDDQDRAAYRQWDQRVAILRKGWTFRPVHDLIERMDTAALTMDEQLQCGAMIAWLLQSHRADFVQFVERMKDPFHERMRFPTNAELFARQAGALHDAFDANAPGLEQRWRQEQGPKVVKR